MARRCHWSERRVFETCERYEIAILDQTRSEMNSHNREMPAERNENWIEDGIELLSGSRGVIRPIKGLITHVTELIYTHSFIELSLAHCASYKEATIPAVSTYGAGLAVLASRLTSLSNRKLAR